MRCETPGRELILLLSALALSSLPFIDLHARLGLGLAAAPMANCGAVTADCAQADWATGLRAAAIMALYTVSWKALAAGWRLALLPTEGDTMHLQDFMLAASSTAPAMYEALGIPREL